MNTDKKNKMARIVKKEDKELVIAKPVTKMPVIHADESKDFIREFNRNVASQEFIDSCKKAGRLFKKRNQF